MTHLTDAELKLRTALHDAGFAKKSPLILKAARAAGADDTEVTVVLDTDRKVVLRRPHGWWALESYSRHGLNVEDGAPAWIGVRLVDERGDCVGRHPGASRNGSARAKGPSFGVSLPSGLDRRLRAYAKARNVSLAVAVAELIDSVLPA